MSAAAAISGPHSGRPQVSIQLLLIKVIPPKGHTDIGLFLRWHRRTTAADAQTADFDDVAPGEPRSALMSRPGDPAEVRSLSNRFNPLGPLVRLVRAIPFRGGRKV